MPQHSVHGPLLFSAYISPTGCTATDYRISLQQYADDTQMYISVSMDDLTVQLSVPETCLRCLYSCLCHSGLGLNINKSETVLLGTSSRIRDFQAVSGVTVAGAVVPICDGIATVRVTLDSRHHVSNVCRSAHFHLRALLHIGRTLTEDMAKILATTQSTLHSSIHASTAPTPLFVAPPPSSDCSVYRTQLSGWYRGTTHAVLLAIFYLNYTSSPFSPEYPSR